MSGNADKRGWEKDREKREKTAVWVIISYHSDIIHNDSWKCMSPWAAMQPNENEEKDREKKENTVVHVIIEI